MAQQVTFLVDQSIASDVQAFIRQHGKPAEPAPVDQDKPAEAAPSKPAAAVDKPAPVNPPAAEPAPSVAPAAALADVRLPAVRISIEFCRAPSARELGRSARRALGRMVARLSSASARIAARLE